MTPDPPIADPFLVERRFARQAAGIYNVPLWLIAPMHADPNPFPRLRLFRWLP